MKRLLSGIGRVITLPIYALAFVALGLVALTVLVIVVIFGAATGWLQIILTALTCVGVYQLLLREGAPYESAPFAMGVACAVLSDIVFYSVIYKSFAFLGKPESFRISVALAVVCGYLGWRLTREPRNAAKERRGDSAPAELIQPYLVAPSIFVGILAYIFAVQLITHYVPALSTFLTYPQFVDDSQ